MRKRHIYYIQQGTDGPIKIGISRNYKTRFQSLQSSSPDVLFLRAVERESPDVTEKYRHVQFHHCRRRGEWFEPNPELLAHIKNLQERVGKEPQTKETAKKATPPQLQLQPQLQPQPQSIKRPALSLQLLLQH